MRFEELERRAGWRRAQRTMDTQASRHAHQEQLLRRLLLACFGDLDAATLEQLCAQLEWVELAGGDVLMEQGQPGDAMYISVSGRLRVYVHDEGRPRMVRELSRGQVIGEMSLFTGEPRSATVVAIRETVLVRLDKATFEGLVITHPALSSALTRQLIRRLLHPQERSLVERPVTMGLLAVSAGVDLASFGARLAEQLMRLGRVRVVDAAAMESELRPYGLSLAMQGPELNRRVALVLDEIEAAAEFVLLVAGPDSGDWTRRCLRHGDELLLVADIHAPPVLHEVEVACLVDRPPRSEAAEILVLLHDGQRPETGKTTRWLNRRPVTEHMHVRLRDEADFQRLARVQSRSAIGLVFAGGGARGFAHLGVLGALREHGVPIDCVGGTSIGAVMALLAATDHPQAMTVDVARRAFKLNPTRDFNPLPLISLIRGERLKRVVGDAIREVAGERPAMEDLPKPLFCVATNVTQAREEVVTHGPLMQALMASIAIPGALPPVVREGDLLCDGGTFNNFPVDVMRRQRGVGTVIGIELGLSGGRPVAFDAMPKWWQLALDRLRPRKRRRYRLPSLASYLLNVTVLYSQSRGQKSRDAVDVYFNPPLERVGLLEWARFDAIVQQGHAHATQVLGELSRDVLERLRGPWSAPSTPWRAAGAGGDAVAPAAAGGDVALQGLVAGRRSAPTTGD